MKKKHTYSIIIFIFLILVIASLIILNLPEKKLVGDDADEHGCKPSTGYQWCPSTEKCQRMWEEYCAEFAEQYRGNKTYCLPEQRNSNICTFLYNPVCGMPMHQTFSNSCIACSNKSVEYYVQGECNE